MKGVDTRIDKKIISKAEAETLEKIKKLKTSSVGYRHNMYGPMIKRKTETINPYSPTNKGKMQANVENMDKRMGVDAPTENVEVMNIDTVVKRRAEDTIEERVKIAKQGDLLVAGFPNILYNTTCTVPSIKQQMIMRGVDFKEHATRKELINILVGISAVNFADDVEKTTIKNRLKLYKNKHGASPIETASSSIQGEKRAGVSNTEPRAKAKIKEHIEASSSGDPHPESHAASISGDPMPKSQPELKAKAKGKLTLPKGE